MHVYIIKHKGISVKNHIFQRATKCDKNASKVECLHSKEANEVGYYYYSAELNLCFLFSLGHKLQENLNGPSSLITKQARRCDPFFFLYPTTKRNQLTVERDQQNSTFSNLHLNTFHCHHTLLQSLLLFPAPFLEELALALAGDRERLGFSLELSGVRIPVNGSLPFCYLCSPLLLKHVEFCHLENPSSGPALWFRN